MPNQRIPKIARAFLDLSPIVFLLLNASIAEAHPERKRVHMASQEMATPSVPDTVNENLPDGAGKPSAPTATTSTAVLSATAPSPTVRPPIDLEAERKVTQKEKAPWEFPVPEPAVPTSPLKRIVIDPGHGGTNEGAIGVAGIHEKYLTLQVALLLADKLRRIMPDVEIILTRERDTTISLVDRIERANELQADLFLSLHFNSSTNPKAVGFESFWAGDFWQADLEKAGVEITDEIAAERTRLGALGYRLAERFNRAMRHRFDVLDRGVKPGNFTVLTRAKVPAVVLEMAFLSHADEGISATQPKHMAKLVDAIAEAVTLYAPTNDSNDASSQEKER